MINFWQTISLFTVFFHGPVSSCWVQNANNYCGRPAEIIAEGNDTWTTLMLYSNQNIKFNLKPNIFTRTPNLITLTLTAVESIQPGALNNLKKLDKLVFFNTFLEEIPQGVIDNLPIRTLQIFKTPLKYLSPGFFDNVPDIFMADIRYNKIQEIKAGIFNNTAIYKIYLNNNDIESIEENAFENMADLIYLNLGGNKLKTFNAERVLGTSISLSQLWLSRNKLTKITKDMFNTIPNLTNLYLEMNQIDHIEAESFDKISFLDFLDLSNNNLTEINPEIFPSEGLNKCRLILLHNNRLTFINKSVFTKLPKVGYISYGGNPFQCPCLDQITEWVSSKNISRICDSEYFTGQRPSCILSKHDKHSCLYDTELTNDLYDIFIEVVGEYSTLHKKCDTTGGADKAALRVIE